jgi:D-3-phosphoglycerate dehydrogenase/(S)-sulfolactate dehydrogenase
MIPGPFSAEEPSVFSDSPPKKRSQRIVVCDDLSPEAFEVFAAHGLTPELRTGLSESELVEVARDAHALIVRSATSITRPVIEAATELRVIGRAGVGVDNIDLDAATERGVVVMNAPTGNTTTTAELAVALLCALARNIPRADRSVRAGSWKKKHLMGTELSQKTLGVVGLGRIGRVVAQRAQGLDMNVIAHDPYMSGPSPVEGVELVELDDLLGRSDFVTLHMPLSDATRHVISRARISLMKPGARLINAARGGLVDEEALAEALDSGRLRGAALDVLEQEPPPADHPLLGRDDVILTPHLGASSDEAQRQVASDIARQISEFLNEGVAHNAVNAPAVTAQTLREIGPYILLAEKIGSFLAQRSPAPIRGLELSLGGDIARSDASHVRLALLVGVLTHGSETPINFVNAPRLAKERGITLHQSKDEQPPFLHSAVRVRARSKREHGGEESHEVVGTVLGRTPHFVRVDDVPLDLAPQGALLLTLHNDQPGVVGLLGTILGRHGVNIRRVELGPVNGADGGPATGFLTLYEPPPAEVIREIAALEPIHHVQLINL